MAKDASSTPTTNDSCAVADEAANTILSLPAAAGNEAVSRLVEFLSFDEPVVDQLPLLFLGSDVELEDPEFIGQLRCIAVAGRLLCARVRWLDDTADSGEIAGSFEDIHRLSAAAHTEAASRLSSALSGLEDTGGFFASLADLDARYATSVALDCAASRRMPKSMSLSSYIEQAKARAVVVRAPMDALMLLRGAGGDETRLARECFGTLAAAMQLADDILDLEEDYEQNALTWIVVDTLAKITDPSPSQNFFYEVALLEGSLENAFAEALRLYEKVALMSRGHFLGIEKFAHAEIARIRTWQDDVAGMVEAAGVTVRICMEPES